MLLFLRAIQDWNSLPTCTIEDDSIKCISSNLHDLLINNYN